MRSYKNTNNTVIQCLTVRRYWDDFVFTSSPKGPLDKKLCDATVLLSATEVGLGSLLHGLHVPLTGHALSLNQGVILTILTARANSVREASKSIHTVSQMSAVLKALSPAGKKLTPMAAISCQGYLYSLGLIFGRNLFGVSFGFILLSLWGFAQPVIIYYLIFGRSLFDGLIKLWVDLATEFGIEPRIGVWILCGTIILKLVLAILLGAYVWLNLDSFEEKYQNWLLKSRQATQPKQRTQTISPLRGALRDLFSPLFLLSFAVSAGFVYFHQSDQAIYAWIFLLRPIAIGFLFYWLARSVSASKFVNRFPSLALVLERLNQESRN